MATSKLDMDRTVEPFQEISISRLGATEREEDGVSVFLHRLPSVAQLAQFGGSAISTWGRRTGAGSGRHIDN